MSRRVLVTGASGFLGGQVVARLVAQGHEVHAAGRSAAAPATFHSLDLTDARALAGLLETVKPEGVFHLAGVMSHPDVAPFYAANTLAAAALLDARVSTGQTAVPLLVMGTAAEYGLVDEADLPVTEDHPARPVTHYGISKLAQTAMCLEAARRGQAVVVARAANLLGPDLPPHFALQSFASQLALIEAGRAPAVLSVGNLESSRDFVDGDDAARLVCRLIETPAAFGQVVHIAGGRAIRISRGLEILIDLFGVDVSVEPDPGRYRAADVSAFCASPARLDALVGPLDLTPIEVTLARMAARERARLAGNRGRGTTPDRPGQDHRL